MTAIQFNSNIPNVVASFSREAIEEFYRKLKNGVLDQTNEDIIFLTSNNLLEFLFDANPYSDSTDSGLKYQLTILESKVVTDKKEVSFENQIFRHHILTKKPTAELNITGIEESLPILYLAWGYGADSSTWSTVHRTIISDIDYSFKSDNDRVLTLELLDDISYIMNSNASTKSAYQVSVLYDADEHDFIYKLKVLYSKFFSSVFPNSTILLEFEEEFNLLLESYIRNFYVNTSDAAPISKGRSYSGETFKEKIEQASKIIKELKKTNEELNTVRQSLEEPLLIRDTNKKIKLNQIAIRSHEDFISRYGALDKIDFKRAGEKWEISHIITRFNKLAAQKRFLEEELGFSLEPILPRGFITKSLIEGPAGGYAALGGSVGVTDLTTTISQPTIPAELEGEKTTYYAIDPKYYASVPYIKELESSGDPRFDTFKDNYLYTGEVKGKLQSGDALKTQYVIGGITETSRPHFLKGGLVYVADEETLRAAADVEEKISQTLSVGTFHRDQYIQYQNDRIVWAYKRRETTNLRVKSANVRTIVPSTYNLTDDYRNRKDAIDSYNIRTMTELSKVDWRITLSKNHGTTLSSFLSKLVSKLNLILELAREGAFVAGSKVGEIEYRLINRSEFMDTDIFTTPTVFFFGSNNLVKKYAKSNPMYTDEDSTLRKVVSQKLSIDDKSKNIVLTYNRPAVLRSTLLDQEPNIMDLKYRSEGRYYLSLFAVPSYTNTNTDGAKVNPFTLVTLEHIWDPKSKKRIIAFLRKYIKKLGSGVSSQIGEEIITNILTLTTSELIDKEGNIRPASQEEISAAFDERLEDMPDDIDPNDGRFARVNLLMTKEVTPDLLTEFLTDIGENLEEEDILTVQQLILNLKVAATTNRIVVDKNNPLSKENFVKEPILAPNFKVDLHNTKNPTDIKDLILHRRQNHYKQLCTMLHQLEVTVLGVPEISTMSEILSNRIFTVQVFEPRSGDLHWLSGRYTLFGFKHIINPRSGYLTSFTLQSIENLFTND